MGRDLAGLPPDQIMRMGLPSCPKAAASSRA